mmetsp:Transcript_13834/g.40683  ORF Transcript_13834/g.40683 Transcript_13834/m.40683 type:complete len:250 (+) Transcript_13834:414-1163(+)
MYAPSRTAPSISSGPLLVTSTVVTTRSSGHSFFRAVTCMTAVRKACGLKRPEIQVTLGVLRSAVHSTSCLCRSRKSASQGESGARDGHASASHVLGTLFSKSAFIRSSMGCEIDRSPRRPASSSRSERPISKTSRFMRSHSCKKKATYGVRSSTLSSISIIKKSSGSFSRISSSCCFTRSPIVIPPSPPPPRGCSSEMALKRSSACRVMKLISEFGCRPYAAGVSRSMFSSTYSRYSLYDRFGGDWKPG